MELIPVTALIAILLFLIKEVVELFKKSAEKRRKVKSIKEILKYEIFHNYKAFKRLYSAISSAERAEIEPDGTDVIVSSVTGVIRYQRLNKDGKVVSSSPIDVVELKEFNRLLPQIAELNLKDYQAIRESYKYIHELKHLSESFLQFLTIQNEKHLLEGFTSYAHDKKDEVGAGVKDAYEEISGEKIPEKLFGYGALTKDS